MASAVLDIAPEHNLSHYFQKIRKYPLLSAEEELQLARRVRDHLDTKAAHALVTSHLRLVARVAMSYRGYGLPIGELISEGNLGLIQAVRRYDPQRGFRLSTYALWWIRAEIQRYIVHSWSLVKIGTTGAQRKLFFNLRRLKAQMHAIDNGDLRPEQVAEIAKQLDVTERDVVSMNRRLAARDQSLNAPVATDVDVEWQDGLLDEHEDQEAAFAVNEEAMARAVLVSGALRKLNDRHRHILIERRLKDTPTSLDELSRHYGISRERVRQIEVAAIAKMQNALAPSMAQRENRRLRPASAFAAS